MIRYAGHRYRLAQEPEAESTDETEPAKSPCVDNPDVSDPFVQATNKTLKAAGVDGRVIRLCREQDGTDIQANVSGAWTGIEAILTLDWNAKQKLQEAVLSMCGHNFVAHSSWLGGAKTLNMLVKAIATLQRAKFSPRVADTTVKDKTKTEYLDYLKHYIAELIRAGVDGLNYDDRSQFAVDIMEKAKAGKYPEDVAKSLMEGATKFVNDQEWKELISELESTQGRQHATTQELIDKAVKQLIPSGEKYTGGVTVVGYFDNGDILAKIDVPKPFDSFMFVFTSSGSKQLSFSTAGLGLCGSSFLVDSPAEAGTLIATMIDLAILAGRTPQPELSEAPKQPENTSVDVKKLRALINRGLVVYETSTGHKRMIWKSGSPQCYSDREWKSDQEEPNDSTYKNWLKQAQRDKLGVFWVHPDGTVDQLNYDGAPARFGVGTITTEGQVCTR